MAHAIVFYIIAATILVSAGIVVFSRSIVYSALALLFALLGVGAVYALLSDDFMAVIQLLLYVGGILVLILFAIMLTNRIENSSASNLAYAKGTAFLLCAAVLAALVAGLLGTEWQSAPAGDAATFVPATARIGHGLLGAYLLPFEVISVLLLAGLVGAVSVARKESRTEDEQE